MPRTACILILALASPAAAQATKSGDLVPIEQGVSDINSVGTSLRVMPVDLGIGNGFSRLYGVAGRPDLLVRSQGGVYAVFEQSDYVRVQRKDISRVYAVWPAGTVFHIGQPDFGSMRTTGIRHGPTAVMLFAPGLQPETRRVSTGPDPRLGQPTSSGPVDRRRPDGRVQTQPLSRSGEVRWDGGLPGYARPAGGRTSATNPSAEVGPPAEPAAKSE
jgi:hypothetical protein